MVFKGLIRTFPALVGGGGTERTIFEHFVLWESVTLFKGLLMMVLIGLILAYVQFWEGVVLLKRLTLDHFYFGRVVIIWRTFFHFCQAGCLGKDNFFKYLFWRVCWYWKDWYCIMFLLGGCVHLEKKKLISTKYYFGRLQWSWKDWYWTDFTQFGSPVW